MLKIFLTNLGKYNEGYLIGKWLELPATDEELKEVKEKIGINHQYEEWFITDYESELEGLKINEYSNIDELNEIAEKLNELDDYYLQIVEGLLIDGYDINNAIEKIDECYIYFDCSTMEDVARVYIEETGMLNDIPDHLVNYFDFEAFGRDLAFSSTFIFLDSGNCIEIC